MENVEIIKERNTAIIDGIKITHIGHASIKITTPENKIIYFDPYAYPEKGYEEKANLVFISHEHFDHCAPEIIKKIAVEGKTKIIAHPNCQSKLLDIKAEKMFLMPGDKREIDGISLEVVHAYNQSKPFHPKGSGNGYVIKLNNLSLYHPGDTDVIDEMKELKGKVDVFFCPISGTYVMDEKDALKAIEYICPSIVIPIHYNYLEGLEKDPYKFKQAAREKFGDDVEVIVLIE